MAELVAQTFLTHDELRGLVPEWVDLYRCSRTRNPFAHPAWLVGWARHFVRDGELYVVTVRDVDRRLVGVAPFYKRRIAVGSIQMATQLDLLGARPDEGLIELPQVLTARGNGRAVLRAVMAHLGQNLDLWDWVEVTLTPEQGWFEPLYLPRDPRRGRGFVVQKSTRTTVVMPLETSWASVKAGLRRNVKESLRRGANRLKREGKSWDLSTPTNQTELWMALDTLAALHAQRARLKGKEWHQNYFADERYFRFFVDVAPTLFHAGQLVPYTLRVEGQPVASRLVLYANETVYFSASGMDPGWWHYCPATTLTGEVLQDAIARGARGATLSTGVDEAKLRWSEHIEQYPVFIMVQPRRRSALAFQLFWQARAAVLVHRARRRFQLEHPDSSDSGP
ncbi:MAG: GNAT family N-acetyltransferase [Chloroflexi bacterium]|nr:GNAT family N-acetyltransferase [Chloroflexota bacterium]